mmetsp:Transcript_4576/g.10682  ORF Transcript_4576/g.10682 Transcript_4576/m.10682 type:complete len:344 (+) Transcript_4576:692-1723(+)
MHDQTERAPCWREALREIHGRVGQLPSVLKAAGDFAISQRGLLELLERNDAIPIGIDLVGQVLEALLVVGDVKGVVDQGLQLVPIEQARPVHVEGVEDVLEEVVAIVLLGRYSLANELGVVAKTIRTARRGDIPCCSCPIDAYLCERVHHSIWIQAALATHIQLAEVITELPELVQVEVPELVCNGCGGLMRIRTADETLKIGRGQRSITTRSEPDVAKGLLRTRSRLALSAGHPSDEVDEFGHLGREPIPRKTKLQSSSPALVHAARWLQDAGDSSVSAGHHSSHELEEHHAEAEDVAPGVPQATLPGLRRGVAWSTAEAMSTRREGSGQAKVDEHWARASV